METRSSRKRPSPSPEPQAEPPKKRQKRNSSNSSSRSSIAASCIVVNNGSSNNGNNNSSNNGSSNSSGHNNNNNPPSPPNPPSSPNPNTITLSPETLRILRVPRRTDSPEYDCLHCGRRPGTRVADCNSQTCYPQFRTTHFDAARPKLEIKRTAPGPHQTGLGVFVRAGQVVRQDEWLGQYLGELLPPDAPEGVSSDYCFSLPGYWRGKEGVKEVLIDGKTQGNWTRFVNSSCRPNVSATPEQVGKVRIVALRATKEIRAGEQVLISYGRGYFEDRKIMCCCDAKARPHLPPKE